MKIRIELEIDGDQEERLPYNLAMRLRDGSSRLGALAIHNCLKRMHRGTNGIPQYSHNHSIRLLLEDVGAVLEGRPAKTFSVRVMQ